MPPEPGDHMMAEGRWERELVKDGRNGGRRDKDECMKFGRKKERINT